jgi:hypothetical protein
LCGRYKYSITSELKHFFQCHCIPCRKATASAFAANIIAIPAEIKWVSGEGNIKQFDYPGLELTQVFCEMFWGERAERYEDGIAVPNNHSLSVIDSDRIIVLELR